jgi:hypothetical protein
VRAEPVRRVSSLTIGTLGQSRAVAAGAAIDAGESRG